MNFKLHALHGFDKSGGFNPSTHYTGMFSADGEHQSIYGKPFVFVLEGFWTVLDKEKIYKDAGKGKKFNPEIAYKILKNELNQILNELAQELPQKYVWSFDDWSVLTHVMRQCKIDKERGSLEKIVYFQEGLNRDYMKKGPQGIIGINSYNIKTDSAPKWIFKKRKDTPEPDFKTQSILNQYDLTKENEDYYLRVCKGFIKADKVGMSYNEIVHRANRGEDFNMRVKEYNSWVANITVTELDNKLDISWTLHSNIKGDLKIFRKTDCFAHDCFSQTDNGKMIIDSFRDGEMSDFIEPNIDYYYTVNFYPWAEEIEKSRKKLSLKEKLFGGKVLSDVQHLNRFSARVSGIAHKEKESFEIKKLEKQQAVDIEQLEYKLKRIQQNIKDLNKDDLLTDHERKKKKLEYDIEYDNFYLEMSIKKKFSQLRRENSIDDMINDVMKDNPNRTRKEVERSVQEFLDNLNI